MGQKVHPIGFRLGVQTKRVNKYTNKISQESFDVFDRKTWFNFSAPLNSSKNLNQSQILHNKFIIKNQVEELFTKSGFILSHFFMEQSSDSLVIKVDIFHRSNTSLLKESLNVEKDLIQSENKDLLEVSFGNPRKLDWTARKLEWRSLKKKDILFLSKFLEENLTAGLPIKWKIRLLNKSMPSSTDSLMKEVYRKLGRLKNQSFFKDGFSIFNLVFQEPHAPLLANYIGQELSQLRKHSTFIQFLKEGLSEGLDYKSQSSEKTEKNSMTKSNSSVNLSGFLIQIKGRINGSDRSRRLTIRKGSIPLHTMDAAIDQSFSEATTIYGKCSVKVWLKQD